MMSFVFVTRTEPRTVFFQVSYCELPARVKVTWAPRASSPESSAPSSAVIRESAEASEPSLQRELVLEHHRVVPVRVSNTRGRRQLERPLTDGLVPRLQQSQRRRPPGLERLGLHGAHDSVRFTRGQRRKVRASEKGHVGGIDDARKHHVARSQRLRALLLPHGLSLTGQEVQELEALSGVDAEHLPHSQP
jgi:hypothetical protein